MKRQSYITILILLISLNSACSNNSKKSEKDDQQDTIRENPLKNYDAKQLPGLYTGKMGGNMLALQINHISRYNASGHNHVKGNKRNIAGSYEARDSVFYFEMTEPGNKENDGIFKFTIHPVTFAAEGTWESKNTPESKAKKFSLQKVSGDENENKKNFLGHWYEEKYELDIEENGLAFASGSTYHEETDEWKTYQVKGSWYIDEKGDLCIEWERNSYMPTAKARLKWDNWHITDHENYFLYPGP